MKKEEINNVCKKLKLNSIIRYNKKLKKNKII